MATSAPWSLDCLDCDSACFGNFLWRHSDFGFTVASVNRVHSQRAERGERREGGEGQEHGRRAGAEREGRWKRERDGEDRERARDWQRRGVAEPRARAHGIDGLAEIAGRNLPLSNVEIKRIERHFQ